MKADNPSEARIWILDKASRHLAAAAEELLAGLKWIDVVEPGSLDRGRQALRIVDEFADHAEELLGITAGPLVEVSE